MRERVVGFLLFVAVLSPAEGTIVTQICNLDVAVAASPVQNLNGLSAKAIFTYDTLLPNVLKIELFNTSTGLPVFVTGSDNANQLLTSISFDLGTPGLGGPQIISGSVIIGPAGRSVNFDKITTQLGPGGTVSGEWGCGNSGGASLLSNFVSTMAAHKTKKFDNTNLDDAAGLEGPQGGIFALKTGTTNPLVPLGGLGAIADSIVITLNLSSSPGNLDFLKNGVVAEFGSDGAFVVPEPATLALFGLGVLVLLIKRRA
jgi:hypothetical protein